MIFDTIQAKRLEVLVHPNVEKAIIELLDIALNQKEDEINNNPECTDAQLRQLQGMKNIVKELKQYRVRLKDTFVREQEKNDSY